MKINFKFHQLFQSIAAFFKEGCCCCCCNTVCCGNCWEELEDAEESPGTCSMACVRATWLPSLLLTALVLVPLLPLLSVTAIISDQYLPPSPAITDVTHDRCLGVYCSIEMCLPLDPCDDGEVHQNATECGCCPLCIKYLDKGRACGPVGVLRFPARPTTKCRPPLKCIDGHCSEGPLRKAMRPAVQDLEDKLFKP